MRAPAKERLIFHYRKGDRHYCGTLKSYWKPTLIVDEWEKVTCKSCMNIKARRDRAERMSLHAVKV